MSASGHWSDLVAIVDPSWLREAGLGDAHQYASLISAPAARRTLRHYLANRFNLSPISEEAASMLQRLGHPQRSRRLAQRLGACAVVDHIRFCIDGARVRSLRRTLGEKFLGSLLGGAYCAANAPLLQSAPALPADVRPDSVEGFLLSIGKGLLLSTAVATDETIRHLIELSLPKQLEAAGLEPARVNCAAVRDALAELSGND